MGRPKIQVNGAVKRQLPLYLMLVPGALLVLVYQYGPMVGIVIAFQKYKPTKGFFNSPFVGLDNFHYIFTLPDFYQILWNTIIIAVMKIVTGLVVPIVFALLLNEIGKELWKRVVQTVIYLPHFLSWVLLAGIMVDILSPSTGIVNAAIKALGFQPVFFLGSNDWFRYVLVISDIWKDFGFGTIVYLAAIVGINPALYEAAIIDGATRWKQTWHITLPGMAPIIVLMTVLSLGQILNAGFDQIFNLYSPIVYETGDIIDTRVYRLAFDEGQYSVATTVGLFKSTISLLFISGSYYLAYRFANYRIF
jgi:putative aldouronate transport system permease protein